MPSEAELDALGTKPKIKRTPKATRQEPHRLDLDRRIRTPEEVSLGFSLEQAQAEALRCVNCKDPKCQEACPIHTDIKGFINKLVDGDYEGAYRVLLATNPFPGICGRVCQYELFCEKECVLARKLEAVAIASLERFVADFHRMSGADDPPEEEITPNGLKVALVGSGPASLMCANDLARKGYRITIFEALHELGGVLAYGIPPFRLPRNIIAEEIDRLKKLGVEFQTDVLVGKTVTLDELFEQGYAAVFLGTGAGLPYLMGIPGENLIGVYTANEFLTRINLMHAWEFPRSETPVLVGERTVVVGGGNSAMDAARWARRLGSEVTILYRRGRAELKARAAEIEHAEEEGVRFEFLAAPVALHGDEKGFVRQMECIRMELGKPDESGRRSPVPVPGSNFRIPADTVVAAIGQGPNPTLQRETPALVTRHGKIAIDTRQKTSLDGVWAGGDVVRGGSTVIQAMQDGRTAAQAIDEALRERFPQAFRAADPLPLPARQPAPPRFRILARRELSPDIVLLEVHAPQIEAHWKPGQFVILRPTPTSERIPLTLVDSSRERSSITLIVQAIGKTTRQTAALEVGDALADLLGPLGKPAHIARVGTVMCVGGGVGVAGAAAGGAGLPPGRQLRNRPVRGAQQGAHHSRRGAAQHTRRGALVYRRRLARLPRQRGRDDARLARARRAAGGRRACDRPDSDDAVRRRADAPVGRAHRRQPESDHGGRHGHVRRLPGDGGRPGALCLRRRTGVQRPRGGFRRARPAHALLHRIRAAGRPDPSVPDRAGRLRAGPSFTLKSRRSLPR